MILVVNWSGQLVAGMFADAADVAIFSVAQRTANLVNFILIGVNFVVTPRFAKLWSANDLESLRELAIKSTAWMTLVAVPLLVAIAVVPSHIMGLFGSEFRSGGILLTILAVGQAFNVMTGSVNALLNMCGFESDLRNIVVVSGMLAIALAVVMTMTWGVLGTSLAVAFTLVFQNTLAVAVVKRRLGFSMFSAFAVLLPTQARKPLLE